MKYALRALFLAVGLLGILPDLVLAQVDSGGGAAPLSVNQDSQSVGQLGFNSSLFQDNSKMFSFRLNNLSGGDVDFFYGIDGGTTFLAKLPRGETILTLSANESFYFVWNGGGESFSFDVEDGDRYNLDLFTSSLYEGEFVLTRQLNNSSAFDWAVWTGFGFGALTAFLTFGRRLLARVATPVFSE